MCFILIEEMTGKEDMMIVEGMTEIEIEGMTDVIWTKDLDQDMVVLIYDLKQNTGGSEDRRLREEVDPEPGRVVETGYVEVHCEGQDLQD